MLHVVIVVIPEEEEEEEEEEEDEGITSSTSRKSGFLPVLKSRGGRRRVCVWVCGCVCVCVGWCVCIVLGGRGSEADNEGIDEEETEDNEGIDEDSAPLPQRSTPPICSAAYLVS